MLVDLLYALKLAPKQVTMFRWILLKSSQCSVKNKFCSVNTECGAAKIYALRLRFSNSNLFLHTFGIYHLTSTPTD